jgi:divalent metal cation (Fe/Co/Zn/Cd) transporter
MWIGARPAGSVLDMATGTPLPTLPVTITGPGDRDARQRLTSCARRLTQLGLAWHALEAAIAIAAGVIAGSVALVGFGADSVIEAGAGLVVLWLVTGGRLSSHRAERRAQQLIAVSFLLLAVYITV